MDQCALWGATDGVSEIATATVHGQLSRTEASITDDQVRELDEQLGECGLTYNAPSELFQTIPRADADAEPVEWQDVMFAVPDLPLNMFANHEEAKQQEWRQGVSAGDPALPPMQRAG